MNELALFAGAGGGILAGKLLGWTTVGAVEINPYCREVLLQRQRDGFLDAFPIWDDICTFDGRPWRGVVDVVSGGFPCQDISVAGKGAGLDGERSGLWSEMARVIGQVRPRFAFVENSPALTFRGLGRVLGDLSELGYDARWGVLSAADAIWLGGTPAIYHDRERVWIVAETRHTNSTHDGAVPQVRKGITDTCRVCEEISNAECVGRLSVRRGTEAISEVLQQHCGIRGAIGSGGELETDASCNKSANADRLHVKRVFAKRTDTQERPVAGERQAGSQNHGDHWWQTEPDVGRVANGVANRLDRLRAIGNGQVPSVAALAWRLLSNK